MLSYAKISSASLIAGNNLGFYRTLGILAIITGVISIILVAMLATPKARDSRNFRWIHKDPFHDNWARQQATFLNQVLEAEPDTLADTIVPGIEPVPTPPDTGRPVVIAKPLVGVVVGAVPEQKCEDGELVLAQIRQSNAEFLARIDAA